MKLDTRSRVGVGERLLAAVPLDLGALIAATLLADAVVVAAPAGAARMAAALPLVFFLPGYALVAALYPEPAEGGVAGRFGSRVTPGGRLALSFGLSVALVPLVALAVWGLGLWVSPGIVALALTGVVLVGATVGATRRLLRPPERRFDPRRVAWLRGVRRAFGPATPRTDRALNVALAVAVLLAAGSLGYGLLAPAAGESYTGATLLTRSGGELVAGEYPSDLAPGERAELVLELANHEGADQSYTVVVQAERVRTDGGSTTVTGATELERLSVDVPSGETRRVPHEVSTDMTGEQIRLSYYVYRGDAPATANAASAYRHLYVWVAVEG